MTTCKDHTPCPVEPSDYIGYHNWADEMIERTERPVVFCFEYNAIKHCQNGRAEICLAGLQDGVCCAGNSCDIDLGVRPDNTIKPRVEDDT